MSSQPLRSSNVWNPWTISCKALFLILLISVYAHAQTNCPNISIIGPNHVLTAEIPGVFTAAVSEGTQKLRFTWAATDGKVSEPYGGPRTEVIPSKEDNGKNITVFVRVEGLPSDCKDTAWEIAPVSMSIEEGPADEFGAKPANDVKAHIDDYYIALMNSPGWIGLVDMSFGLKETTHQRLIRINRILAAIKFRNYDINRFSFKLTENGETSGNTSLWIVKPGFDPSKQRIGRIISGADLRRNPKKALPKRQCLCDPK